MDFEDRKYQVNRRTLTVLLIVSFFNTGNSLLSELLLACSGPGLREAMMEWYAQLPEKYSMYAIAMQRLLEVPQWYYLLVAVLDAASIAGLVLMCHLRKSGFHCYTLSKLLLMLMPMLFLGRSHVSIGDMMIAVLVIAYYFFLMKSMGVFDDKSAEQEQMQG